MEGKRYTKAGTDIEEVKRLNAESGLSYNEVKALLAQSSEVNKVNEVPTYNKNLEIDSDSYKINQVPDSSININSNDPR